VEKGAAEGGKLAIQIGREAFVERAWEWAEYGGVIMS
jgi:valyl-tRNA synthetase